MQLSEMHGREGLTELMAYWLASWITNTGSRDSKPLCSSKVDSAFHPTEVDQMSARKSCSHVVFYHWFTFHPV